MGIQMCSNEGADPLLGSIKGHNKENFDISSKHPSHESLVGMH